MATLSDRVAEAHQAAQDATEVAQLGPTMRQTNWEATVTQLKRLIEVELDVTDVPEPVHIHREPSHGLPETDYAVVQVDDVWLGLPVSDNPSSDVRLLGILHCDGGHILGYVTPVTADDTWVTTMAHMERHYEGRDKSTLCESCAREGNVPRNRTVFPTITAP